MKTCFKCHETKPLAEFYRHPQMADKHLNKCKECTKRDVRLHRQSNDSVRAYDRRRSKLPERLASSSAYARRWRRKNPDGYAAHAKLSNAVHGGKVKKPERCQLCGKQTTSRSLHGHHDDYSKPLDVEWRCARCHAKELRKP